MINNGQYENIMVTYKPYIFFLTHLRFSYIKSIREQNPFNLPFFIENAVINYVYTSNLPTITFAWSSINKNHHISQGVSNPLCF